MTKAHLLLLCGLVVLAGRDCLSADVSTLNAEQIKRFVLFAPKPYYPQSGSTRIQDGSWRVSLNVDQETGLVASIKIERTTGLWSLDVSCLKALIRWRFKPRTLTKIHVPVRFAIDQT